MPKKLLLTGIGGSIGVHFLSYFLKNTDWEVVGVDSFRHKGWTDRLAEHFEGHPDHKSRTKIITHDLVAPFSELMKEKIGTIDYIVNLASLSDVEASIKDPVTFIHNNVMLVTHLLEYAREVKPKAFIQFSTDEVYGPTQTKEEKLSEWSPFVPSNPYAASKACQEMITISYWRTYNVPVIITNTMNNFGELQQPSKFPVMVQKAVLDDEEITIHGGENGEMGSRSYIHSQNVASAILFLLRLRQPYLHIAGKADRPDRYNIAGDKQLDNLELARTISRLMGKELKYKIVNFHSTRPGHDPHYGLDNSKLTSLGWRPPHTFEQSLKNTIEWQTDHQEWIR